LNALILAVGFGLVTASVLALAAVGLTLQVGVTNLVNFAVADFLTLGAYITWALHIQLHVNFWLAIVGASLVVGGVAMVANIVLIRPFARRRPPTYYLLIVTLGLSLIISNLILATWGPDYRSFDQPIQQPVHVGPFLLSTNQLLIMGIAVVIMAGVWLLLSRTQVGRAMRAMADNLDLARNCGIDTDRVAHLIWFMSGALAAIAGAVLALNVTEFEPSLGPNILFVLFSVMILGGIGSPYGAMLAAIVVGISTEVSAALFNAAYKNDIAFLILIAVLMIRPSGIIRMAGKN
jgi:branched-chain amino acid transport system permease protein/neutral amino acid transport system permease protein